MTSPENFDLRSYNWENKSILIVEDDIPSYIFLKAILGMTKVNIIHVKNGSDAIDYCNNNEVDLILMDIQLPGISGYDATRKIKESKPDLPVVAQTAFALTGEREKSEEAGCDDYITKPINKIQLIKILERFLN